MKRKLYLALSLLMGIIIFAGCAQNKGNENNSKSGSGSGLVSGKETENDDASMNYSNTDYYEITSAKEVREKNEEGDEEFAVYYYRPTCSDCQAFKPILEEILRELDIKVIAVDVDADVNGAPYLLESAASSKVPTLVRYNKGVAEEVLIETFSKEEAIALFNNIDK